MLISLTGLLITLIVALTDARPTVSLGCWLLASMFLWFLIEELWFLYKQHRNSKE